MIDRSPVRLATFNVLHGRVPGDDGSPVAVEPLVEAVAALDAEVTVLQELDRRQPRSGRTDQARVVAEALGVADWRYASAFHARARPGRSWARARTAPGLRVYGPPGTGPGGELPSHGIALLSRLPVRHWRARRLAEPPVAAVLPATGRAGLRVVRDHPRVALAAVLEGRRGPFTAVALHLSFVPGWNVRQLLAVRSWIEDLPRPHVLLGDLNLPGRVPAAVLGRDWCGTARTPTFPAHRPRLQLDHVLTSGLGPHGPLPPVRVPRPTVSDHLPLVVELPL
ncbi:endonuclease/exonuclease/phosphatase family protein [Kitasatospora sp. NPDC096147]|uniref:endonuclease/exonuclease/phosphatase family protein n=1 Tax=Kitasatospora sp. NPDC096147 TaxID=3364093 RepID=UPI003812C8AE